MNSVLSKNFKMFLKVLTILGVVFGFGGDKIKIRLILAIIIVFSMVMISLSDISATSFNSTTDLTAPTIKSTNPTNNAVNIAVNKVIKVTFSESIKKRSGWIELKNSVGKNVSITTSISGNVLTITPASKLARGTKYTLFVHSGSVTDLSGNKYVYSGCTTFKTDGTAPAVKSTDPTNNAVNVAVNKIVKITFSEKIKKGTGLIVLKTSSGKIVSINTSISGNVLTIMPKSNLSKGTKYVLFLYNGSVVDLSGNKYVYKGYTSFRTLLPKLIGYWMFSKDAKCLTTTKAQALKSKGITDVYVCTKDIYGNYHLSELQNAITLLHKQGIRVHAWITCFKDDSWVNPSSSSYQSKLISKIKSIVSNYEVDGIHLDCVRYPGTAYKHKNASQIIANFVSKVNNVIGNKILSCAVMAEGSKTAYFYGQDYSLMSKYCNYLCPMAYKGNYGQSTSWITSVVKYVVQHSSCKVYAGLTTYYSDSNQRSLSASEMQKDVNSAKKGGASAIVLFRYKLGYNGIISV